MSSTLEKALGQTLTWARVAKVVGLVGFVLPWLTVSCSGRPLLTSSGLNMALGKVEVTNPMNGAAQVQNYDTSVQIFIILALVVVVAGLALSFWSKATKRAAPILLAGGLIGAALSGGAMAGATSAIQRELSKPQKPNDEYSAMAASMFTVQTRYGFWVTMGGLLAGAALAGAAWSGYTRLRLPQAARDEVTPPDSPPSAP